MKKIIFATINQTKLTDAQNAFNKLGIEIVGKKIDVSEIQSLDQEKIARHKAKKAYELLNTPLFVDDTGFYINSYSQFPGTLTKHVNKALGLHGITRLFDEGQSAYFRTLLCYIDNEKEIIAEGFLRGKLTKSVSKSFNPNTPLNSIFIPEGHTSPLADCVDHIDGTTIRNGHRVAALHHLSVQLSAL